MQQYTDHTDSYGAFRCHPDTLIRQLPPRELQVAELVAEGLKNHSIARRLSLSPATVATYVQRIQSRLRLSGRNEIATWMK